MDRLSGSGTEPAWDRFAHWQAWPARLLLATVVVLLALAAFAPSATTPGDADATEFRNGHPAIDGAAPQPGPARDEDLALYDRVTERVAAGESYYAVVVEEQRARNFPVRPGVTVRLPTLAYANAWLGKPGMIVISIALLAACAGAWWRRLGDESGGAPRQRIGTALMLVGGALVLNPYYFALHEMWAGLLVALAFGLHRPGRWHASLAVAALALAIRELALPFVLLMSAMAVWRRDWREAAAWAALTAAFLVAMAWHLSLVAPHVLASDPEGPSWLALRGLTGWRDNVVLSSNLHYLPGVIAGPLVLLMLLGWAGWKSPAGATGTLLYGGYGLAFMIAGRTNNFYWGAMVVPAMFIGLAFLPMAVRSLLRSSGGTR